MVREKGVSILVVTSSPVLKRQVLENITGERIKLEFLADKKKLMAEKEYPEFDVWIIDADFFKKDLLTQLLAIRQKYRRLPIFVVGAPVKEQEFTAAELNECGIDEYFERTDVWGNPSLILERLQYYARLGKKPRRRKLPKKHAGGFNLILIGASTGGPEVLEHLIYDLPKNVPPILLVQHIDFKFADAFYDKMLAISGLKKGFMREGSPLERGHLYVPTGEFNMGVKRVRNQLVLTLDTTKKINSHIPSVDFLFTSATNIQERICAILLTGLGNDGARPLAALRKQGAYTMVQDKASSPVFGMPEEAIKVGAAEFIGNPKEIREALLAHV